MSKFFLWRNPLTLKGLRQYNTSMKLLDLIPVLQIAIGPVILISGVALLMGSMNNRLGRTIDRSRALIAAWNSSANDDDRARQYHQLAILWRRAKILRTAITLAAISVLSAAFLIIVLFTSALLRLESATVVIGLFVVCLGAMIASLIYYICDVNMSLHALSREMDACEPYS
jgi:hypothetical protein